MRRGNGAHTEAIVAAAQRLLEQNGSFTTQELIKEAGVALQTLYRHFESKDRILVAVITDIISTNCGVFADQASGIDDPVERLHSYVTTALRALRQEDGRLTPRGITSEHWRLQQLFPHEMAEATKPFSDLVQKELEAAAASGAIKASDHERDAGLITTLVMSVYHEYSFLPDDPRIETIADDVWAFCLAAVGGVKSDAPSARRRHKSR